jgi:hypothetical protein
MRHRARGRLMSPLRPMAEWGRSDSHVSLLHKYASRR